MSKQNNMAVLLILIILGSLGLLAWASNKGASVVGPTVMRRGPDGSVYVACDTMLYIHDAQGGLKDAIPFAKFGMDRAIGDFWVFRSGDLLLRRGSEQGMTFWREIEMFLRMGSGDGDNAPAVEGILQRCSMPSFNCTAFGAGGDAFKKMGAFKLFIDEDAGRVYVADTLGHELLLYDMNGIQLSRSGPAFKFPNQILLGADGLLYVADTNNHRIAAVSADPGMFGKLNKTYEITGGPRMVGKVWPFALEPLAGSGWLVGNAGENMSYGTVALYDQDFSEARQVDLPAGSDPLAIVALDEHVLITDPTLMRIYSLGHDGTARDDFGSQMLKLHLSELLRQKSYYQALERLAMAIVLVSAIAALVIAVLMRQKNAQPPAEAPRAAAGPVLVRYDYHSLNGRIKKVNIALAVSLGFALLFFGATPLRTHPAYLLLAMASALAVVAAHYLSRQLQTAGIELTDQGILFIMGNKRVYSPWQGVREIRAFGAWQHRIITDAGKIPVGRIEPADGAVRAWSDLSGREGDRFARALVDEVRKRAPHVKVSKSWFA